MMAGTEGTKTKVGVILGVDTHLDFHMAVVLDHLGRRLGELCVPTTANGYEKLLCWVEGFGPMRCAGIEGTSSYGAGLARHLKARGIEVLEVERPSAGGQARAVTPRSPTPWMPRLPHERCLPARRRVYPRVVRAV